VAKRPSTRSPRVKPAQPSRPVVSAAALYDTSRTQWWRILLGGGNLEWELLHDKTAELVHEAVPDCDVEVSHLAFLAEPPNPDDRFTRFGERLRSAGLEIGAISRGHLNFVGDLRDVVGDGRGTDAQRDAMRSRMQRADALIAYAIGQMADQQLLVVSDSLQIASVLARAARFRIEKHAVGGPNILLAPKRALHVGELASFDAQKPNRDHIRIVDLAIESFAPIQHRQGDVSRPRAIEETTRF
jgi:hypothetical protein